MQFRRKHKSREIFPDEIFMDSSNLCKFDTDQLEGRLEKPISRNTLYSIGGLFLVIVSVFIFQAVKLQLVKGSEYREKSENNMLRPVPIFAGRGVIYDRNGIMLAWNAPDTKFIENLEKSNSLIESDYVSLRKYATSTGLSHVLGYVQYPSKDSNGFYYQEDFEGVTGVEKYFDENLKGVAGSRLIEVDARGNVVSENMVRPATQGENVTLSIDQRVQSALYANLKEVATSVGFSGGAGIIMDVNSGEIIALTSYPEFSSQVMSDKKDQAAIKASLNNPDLPFLDRAVDGLYTPGSIIKPYIGIGVLNEKIIDPSVTIKYSGSISIPNPYDPTKFSVFRDWKAHGPIDFRNAIAVSSDVYFYTVGGGYKEQKGLGIANIDKYLTMFGFGQPIDESFVSGKIGTIPTPAWKKETFNENWYIGDTYHTVIGQYGFMTTPVQVVRAVAAMANNGKILTPTIIKGDGPHIEKTVGLPEEYFDIVREGMRMSVTVGTSVALNVPYVKFAGKSGTAELGVSKANVNSWITGFWPYENPKYAFVLILEHGSVHNLIGAAASMRKTIDWMNINTPEYFR